MAVDLKDEYQRRVVTNMLVMRALTPILSDISEDQYAAVHKAASEAIKEVSRMSIIGMTIYMEPGTPEQEAADAEQIAQIDRALNG